MGYDYNDSDGQVMAKAHGLKSPQPIMCSARESDLSMHMFQSCNKYYLWDPNVGDTWEIVTAANAMDIMTKIAKQGLKALKLTEVPQVSISG
jgi:hypothetical protein